MTAKLAASNKTNLLSQFCMSEVWGGSSLLRSLLRVSQGQNQDFGHFGSYLKTLEDRFPWCYRTDELSAGPALSSLKLLTLVPVWPLHPLPASKQQWHIKPSHALNCFVFLVCSPLVCCQGLIWLHWVSLSNPGYSLF